MRRGFGCPSAAFNLMRKRPSLQELWCLHIWIQAEHLLTPASLCKVNLITPPTGEPVEDVPKRHNTTLWLDFKSTDTVTFRFFNIQATSRFKIKRWTWQKWMCLLYMYRQCEHNYTDMGNNYKLVLYIHKQIVLGLFHAIEFHINILWIKYMLIKLPQVK